MERICAITLDLDDTLWPVWPAIARAEAALHGWLSVHAPATARAFDTCALRLLRQQLAAEQPERAHDLSRLRLDSLRLALCSAGEDVAKADAAFDVFLAARQAVDLYADVVPALERLAGRYPILAVTNGNADLQRTGVAHWFRGIVSAGEFGVGKPDRRIFQEACRRLGLVAQQVLHAGDDRVLDVDAALSAGLQACWVRRAGGTSAGEPVAAAPASGSDAVGEAVWTVTGLTALADRLGC